MSKIGFVIPCYKEAEAIAKTIPNILFYFKDAEIIVVADDLVTAQAAKKAGAFTLYFNMRMGFSRSLLIGMSQAHFLGCNMIVTADVDHPFYQIKDFIKKLEDNDVVVGHESGTWKRSRVWSNALIRKLILNDVSNPTCGFVLWKSDNLSNFLGTCLARMRCQYDMVHPELLYYAKKNGAKITECPFTEVQKDRHYAVKRYFVWLLSFLDLVVRKYIGE